MSECVPVVFRPRDCVRPPRVVDVNLWHDRERSSVVDYLEGLLYRGDTVVAGVGQGRVHRWRGYLFDAGPQRSVDVEVGPVLPPDFQDAAFEDFEAVFVSELLE